MIMVGPQRHATIETLPPLYNNKFSTPVKMSTNFETFSNKNEDHCLEKGYYLHQKFLGEGGFGKVRLGTHLKTNQRVAVKMMNKAKLGQDLQRVRIEIEALKVLQHENIAKLLQVIETEVDIYLILEYCSGGELFDYLIAKRRLTESEVRIIFKDLFKVLKYIHDLGFAHRDLKPENILFDSKHRIKLIDFGLAANSSKNKTALAFLSTCCGSPAYAAPELLRGQTYSGPAVDVWSAGVLLYSLLVGKLPFDDDNLNNLYKKIQIGSFSLPQWLSSDAQDLISSMLKINPAERITVSKVLNHLWLKKCQSGIEPLTNHQTQADPIDFEALKCCQSLFPELTEAELLVKIKNFGYHTATYLLLKNKPEVINTLNQSNQDKFRSLADQQQQINVFMEPRVTAIKRKLQLDLDLNIKNDPIKKIKENVHVSEPNENKKIQQSKFNRIAFNSPINKIESPVFLIERRKMLTAQTNNVKNGVGVSPNTTATKTPNRMTTQTVRRIVSPKMKLKENDENNENKLEKMISNKKALDENISQDKNFVKSPLRDVRNQLVLSPNSFNSPIESTKQNQTPKKSAKSSSKKSLLRRLMASATPAKSNLPRKLDAVNHSNNITLTAFKNPQECIDRLKDTLNKKGVECKQKDFILKCFYSDKIHSALKFDLEICCFNGLCVIHRKRLQGDAWNYKKICELILQLSNEQQLIALGQQHVDVKSQIESRSMKISSL